MDTSQSRQRLDLEAAAAKLQVQINKMQSDREVLMAAFKAIDTDNADILKDQSFLAQEARSIMKSLSLSI